MKYHGVAAVQPLRSFAKQFGLGFHPKRRLSRLYQCLREPPSGQAPEKKWQIRKILVEVFLP